MSTKLYVIDKLAVDDLTEKIPSLKYKLAYGVAAATSEKVRETFPVRVTGATAKSIYPKRGPRGNTKWYNVGARGKLIAKYAPGRNFGYLRTIQEKYRYYNHIKSVARQFIRSDIPTDIINRAIKRAEKNAASS